MNSITYTEGAFLPLNFGLSCVDLDLSSGSNHFDFHLLNNDTTDSESEMFGQIANPAPATFCAAMRKDVRTLIKQSLKDIVVSVPTFSVIGGSVRLNHLATSAIVLDWRADQGGSIGARLNFESTGKELLGAYHGDINQGLLAIDLALGIHPQSGRVIATPHVSFDAHINIQGIPDQLEILLGIRSKIRREVAKQALDAIDEHATNLARSLVMMLGADSVPPMPSDPFLTQIAIDGLSGTFSWADSVKHRNIVLETLTPGHAGSEETLSVSLSASSEGVAPMAVTRSAGPDSTLELPLALTSVPIVDGRPLVVSVAVRAIRTIAGLSPKLLWVDEIEQELQFPSYGSGLVSAHSEGLSAQLRISGASRPGF